MAKGEKFDLVIIGGGPGGYVAAVRAAQLGFKTACVEKSERLGGVCLREGCIPSKALLDSSEMFELARDRMAGHGIRIGEIGFDLKEMMQRKDKVVRELTDNVRKLLENHRITIVHGTGRLTGSNRIAVSGADGDRELEAEHILLATGSRATALPDLPFDGKKVLSSRDALSLSDLPERLCIVGGGYIGLELGSVWRRLGAKVAVVEMLDRIAPTMDGQVSRSLKRILGRQGIEFRLRTRVAGADLSGDAIRVELESQKKTENIECDRLLVAVGRRPLTEGLGLETAGVKKEERSGRIPVDAAYRTNVAGIYAIGDLVDGPMLAHKASAEGIAAVEGMAGKAGSVNYDAIPSVVYTFPEAASVGLTEEQVKERDIPYRSGAYPFSRRSPGAMHGGNGRAGEGARPRAYRPAAGRAHHRCAGIGNDRRSGVGHGDGRRLRGYRPHRSRTSHFFRGLSGSGQGCRGEKIGGLVKEVKRTS